MVGKPKYFQLFYKIISRKMGDVFKAIADPTRREILLMLVEEQSSIGQIAENFNMSRPAIAKHVKVLQNANLLNIEPDRADGRQRNCVVQLEALKEVGDYLTRVEKFWQKKLNGLEAYLAKENKK
ncbi:MAG: transcriptional regulator [Crocinitomicaceae bacterium]|nr:transcriptional regulator [Crocinitomicaceae bacterium]